MLTGDTLKEVCAEAKRRGLDDLGIRLKRKLHRWHVKVAFQDGRDEALLGHIGFLEHFTATSNGPERYATLRPSGTFPMPIMPT